MKLFNSKVLAASAEGSGLGFGCMGISAFYGAAMEDAKAIELLKGVYDGGCRHFDTAEVYRMEGSKPNETIIGEFLQTVPRDSYSIATKYWPGHDNPNVYEYDDVKAHLKSSLERLQLEYVDLYYAHRVFSVEGGIKFAKACQKLKEEGLIKEAGLSEVSGKWLKQIHQEGGTIDAVQQEWSLMTRSLEEEMVPVCKELGIAIVAYSPLSRNMLAKKTEVLADKTDFRANLPRYSKENIDNNNQIVEKVQELGKKHNASAAQVSLAWLFHKAEELGVAVIPIPGTTKIKNATDNFGSVKVKLTDEDCTELETLAGKVAGERYQESFMGNNMSIESQK
ncbi:Aldo-keto reductase yakc [NADP(+)] [Seminavis robusta]|uniref:Aldo-keto reductase yakc [NADP(+)] n=1 Tax=Seminavis robusta TaxID=568900 RepID=A0A9N8ENH5_9STRA|nr:Aldo-keto reductase yakc [NADP(+)] [Seminavis robusta]|eukprot:Sro1527_g279890.1 Aldo-keto reductase yakc [NADP(+)] (337) ;mRNA; r:10688-11698